MKKDLFTKKDSGNISDLPSPLQPSADSSINRRKFVSMVSSAAVAFTIVPRHVLGGKNFVAPSDKITLAYIGIGTQGIRELLPLLSIRELQIVAVCDPNETATGYRDWAKDWLINEIRKAIQEPGWQPGGDNIIPGGLQNGKYIVDTYYSKLRADQRFKSCAGYTDFRELFEKEKDLDAVKIMTPDHLHGIIAMAALKRGKHVSMHKPLSNRLLESKKVIELAGKSQATTHLIPWEANRSLDPILSWIKQGAIGALQEVHNWTNRPVWPQYPVLPVDTPAVPKGFNWDLWLGPEADRPYHPHYTNMVFRGWYDFGGGSMADMGHYSLWSVFNALQLSGPTIIEPNFSHYCGMNEPLPFTVKNDFSFPMASMVRFKYPAKGTRPAVDLCWYDGGMRPRIPDELLADNKELPAEGMLFTGDKGMILGGFYGENPQILPKERLKIVNNPVAPKLTQQEDPTNGFTHFLTDVKQGRQTAGSFREAGDLSEAINLYAVALRSGKLLKYDPVTMHITNYTDADKYLNRVYRKGWGPEEI
ncbi:MAG: Gfo/Idh/MocA family oxidoreductase [Chitinophagaceae bacterium]|nr:Gfo/Idh/MocA family oxidoreductase [Chitinophagaceae bacterium]